MSQHIPLHGSPSAAELDGWFEKRPYTKPDEFYRRVHEEPQVLGGLVEKGLAPFPTWWKPAERFNWDYRLWHAKTWADRTLVNGVFLRTQDAQLKQLTAEGKEGAVDPFPSKQRDEADEQALNKYFEQWKEQQQQSGVMGVLFPQGSFTQSPLGMGMIGGFTAGWLTNVGGRVMKTPSGVWVVCPFRIRAACACVPAFFSGLFFAGILTVGGLLRGG